MAIYQNQSSSQRGLQQADVPTSDFPTQQEQGQQAPQAQPQQAPVQARNGTGYLNLMGLLGLNQDASKGMAQKITGNVVQRGTAVQRDLGQVQNRFDQSLKANTATFQAPPALPQYDSDAPGEYAAAARRQRQQLGPAPQAYAGPMSLADDNAYSKLLADALDAQTRGQMAGSDVGRLGLTLDTYGGGNLLDSVLAGLADPQAFAQAEQANKGLMDTIGKATQASADKAQAALKGNADAQAQYQSALDMLTKTAKTSQAKTDKKRKGEVARRKNDSRNRGVLD